jgi:Tc5 transposase DNA-binding domain
MIQAGREYLRRKDNGDFITIKELASHRKLNKASLQRYVALIRDNKPLPSLAQPQGGQNKCLSDVVEQALIQFLLRMQEGVMPPNPGMVRSFANELRRRLDSSSPPVSDTWLSRFCQRHPELFVKKRRPMDVARIGAHMVGDILAWFQKYETLLQKYNITASHLCNFDETGFLIGVLKSSKVVVSRARKNQDVSVLKEVQVISAPTDYQDYCS